MFETVQEIKKQYQATKDFLEGYLEGHLDPAEYKRFEELLGNQEDSSTDIENFTELLESVLTFCTKENRGILEENSHLRKNTELLKRLNDTLQAEADEQTIRILWN